MALDIRSQLTHKETNKKIRILWLSEDDMVEAGVLDAGRAVDVMEEVVGLLEDGDAIMGGPDHDQHGMMLNDVETGAPLAYMSANLLSSIRTGAMPGLAAKLLAIKDSKTLALIGRPLKLWDSPITF